MSFIEYKKFISFGDSVILYLGYDDLQPIIIGKDLVHQTKYGAIKHNDLIGKEFGSKFMISKGFVHILHPTAELWTISLPHRTQILYNVDISEIIFKLDIGPGSVVVEAGTGSGSLSHSFLRSVYPSGHLHTFDFHAGRVDDARAEFTAHGFDSNLVTIKQRDVCSEGFDLNGRCVDAVFLDLPSPWLAIPHAANVLFEGGRICCFSPCMEQVQKTYFVLVENHFSDLTTVECLSRELNVRDSSLVVPDLGFHNRNKNKKTENNIRNNFNTSPIINIGKDIDCAVELGQNVKEISENNLNVTNYDSLEGDNEPESKITSEDQIPSKKVKLVKIDNNLYCKDCIENRNVIKNNGVKSEDEKSESGEYGKKVKSDQNNDFSKFSNKNKELNLVTLSSGLKITGHTGYLTFGSLYPF